MHEAHNDTCNCVETQCIYLYNGCPLTAMAESVFKNIIFRIKSFMNPAEIEQLILAGLPGSQVRVLSDDGSHFEAVVVTEAFEGKRSLQRHQMIYKTLGELVGGEIHALSIQAMTPSEQGGA